MCWCSFHLTKRSLREEQIDGSQESLCSSSLLPEVVAVVVALLVLDTFSLVNQDEPLFAEPLASPVFGGFPGDFFNAFVLSEASIISLPTPLLLKNSSMALPKT
jgi:hypothetical protein